MPDQRPEAGVEYAGEPTAEYRAAKQFEAVKALAKAWNVSEARATECLGDVAEYRSEYRAHMTPQRALRQLEQRFAPAHLGSR
jgi:hypothetical protein